MQGTGLMSYFKTNLKTLMLKKSVELDRPLNRSQIADATGLSLPTITRWYNGKVDSVESRTVDALIEFFGCDYSELVEYIHE